MMYSRTVTLCKARHLRNYIAQEIGYNVDFQFDYELDEVRATFSCSDDYADIRLCHNDDDLTEYIIRRYGAFIIKEGIPNPINFSMNMKKIGEILTNPDLQGSHKTSYQDEYVQIIDKPDWIQLKLDKKDITAEATITRPGYKPDGYRIRFGVWHG